MLDLDSLAEKRAQSLNQPSETWRTAVWEPLFQKLTQSMSDGEVEALVSYCPSVDHFEAVVRFLDQRCAQKKTSPFVVLDGEARAAGLSNEEWVKRFRAGTGRS
jgi:uncharacterized protein involved in tellurium resistance